MKALSIKQPWAWLILNGGKNIENRTWNTKFRGRFLIHASKQEDKWAMKHFQLIGLINPDDMIHGAIIGSVELVDVVKSSDSNWFHGPYGFILKDPKPEVIRFTKGRLGFYEV